MDRRWFALLTLAAGSAVCAAEPAGQVRFSTEHAVLARTASRAATSEAFDIRASLTRRDPPHGEGFKIVRSNLSSKALAGSCGAQPGGTIFRDGFE